MKEILAELNKEVGVRGSLIVTYDGIVVASDLGTGLQQDVVGAIASSAIQTIRKALGAIGQSGFTRFILNASHGKMVFNDLRIAYLVAVLDKRINLDLTLISIDGAAYRIRNKAQFSA